VFAKLPGCRHPDAAARRGQGGADPQVRPPGGGVGAVGRRYCPFGIKNACLLCPVLAAQYHGQISVATPGLTLDLE
jgi:hypothetical protein